MNKKTYFSTITALIIFSFFYFQGREQARFDSLPKSVKNIINTPLIVTENKKLGPIGKSENSKKKESKDEIHHGLNEQELSSINLLVDIKEVTEDSRILQSMNESERLLLFNHFKQMLKEPSTHWLAKRQILSHKSPYSLFDSEVERMRTLASVDPRAIVYSKLSESEFIELVLENSNKDDK